MPLWLLELRVFNATIIGERWATALGEFWGRRGLKACPLSTDSNTGLLWTFGAPQLDFFNDMCAYLSLHLRKSSLYGVKLSASPKHALITEAQCYSSISLLTGTPPYRKERTQWDTNAPAKLLVTKASKRRSLVQKAYASCQYASLPQSRKSKQLPLSTLLLEA